MLFGHPPPVRKICVLTLGAVLLGSAAQAEPTAAHANAAHADAGAAPDAVGARGPGGAPMDPAWFDARVTAIAQYFQQALVPGLPGAVTQVEAALPFTITAFSRFGGVRLAGGELTGELSAWGRVGPRDALLGDGDLTAAWAQLERGMLKLKLGRQVTLPGAARYVRFDGATLGFTFGLAELTVYGGWVALPRWNLPRGAVLAGFAGDALLDPYLVEQQNRAGQLAAGARLAMRFGGYGRAGLGYHEQYDARGLAFRVVGLDAAGQPASWLTIGGRVTFDLVAQAVPEARLFADVTGVRVPFSIDYSYQSPALLLPKTSLLAAFGGAAWHELGAETTVALPVSLKLTGRVAGQLFDGELPGGRASLRLQWTPGLAGRLFVLAEAGRALVPPAGFTWARAGARYRATETLWGSVDAAVYFYDVAVRGYRSSVTGIGSLEWYVLPLVRTVFSATVMSTPFAAFEAQGLVRLVVELTPNSAGGIL